MLQTLRSHCRIALFAGLMILCIQSGSWALTIEADDQFAYAEALFKNRQYFEAAQEYQRFTFFFPDDPKYPQAVFQTGVSFLLAQNPARALDFFKILSTADPLDALAVASFFKMAECYQLMNAPTHAIVQLNNLIELSDDPVIRDRAYYQIAWIHIELTDWAGARKAVDQITPTGRQRYGWAELSKALSSAEDIPTKSPALAGTLSIIPGGGQLYCRRYEDALIAFVVNAGLVWAAFDAFDNEQYGLGGLLSFVGLGFYAGNIYGAVNDAHKFNDRQQRGFVDQLRQYRVYETGPPGDAARKGITISLKISF